MTNQNPMTKPAYEMPEELERGDSCYGEVIGACRTGIFIRLEGGTTCFSYDCANLRPGSRVLCSFRRPGYDRPLVDVDSVLEYAPLCRAA